ncbi:hypothetical protein K7X08_023015 [Anisodus acutangulus]|uniref:Uncharacterized protein n=1 Tax=Anisodus acutangulus TaxID=402998 RepID=A0A9Q1MER2_9SOLA|nr:hypothetical protein K7X08_023015 [Anisodus acutangulus]
MVFQMLLYSRQTSRCSCWQQWPRILNWKVTDSSTYAGFINGVIMPSLDKDEDSNISPPPHLRIMEKQPKHSHPQNTEQQSILRRDPSGSRDDL